VADAGFPDLTNLQMIGPVAPAGTPKPMIELIAQAVRTALAEPAYQQKLIECDFLPTRIDGRTFSNFLFNGCRRKARGTPSVLTGRCQIDEPGLHNALISSSVMPEHF